MSACNVLHFIASHAAIYLFMKKVLVTFTFLHSKEFEHGKAVANEIANAKIHQPAQGLRHQAANEIRERAATTSSGEVSC